jgi:peptidoglycan/xylan/chitin deacetylase (PgdA/CDA1 family)
MCQTVRDLRPRTAKNYIRHGALSLLAPLNALRHGEQLWSRPRVQFLLFHHLFDEEIPAFRALVAHLELRYRFISYGDAVKRVHTGRIDEPCLAFSFDDGLKSCLTAAGVLEDFGARACFFVCPGVVGAGEHETAEFCRARLRHAPVEFLDWNDLQRLRSHGHEIGAHTVNHVNLAELPGDDARHEIDESRRLLQHRVGFVRHFAWPYGQAQDITPAALRAVREAGFESCASGMRGCHDTEAAPQVANELAGCLRRDSLVAGWPLAHALYFLRRSARRPVGFAAPTQRVAATAA